MELLAVLLVVGALWLGHKAGTEGGRNSLLEAQSRSISDSLSSDNDFYQKTGLHGCFLLEGHEYRSPTGYVIVRYSDLENALQRGADISFDALVEEAENSQLPEGTEGESDAQSGQSTAQAAQLQRTYVPSAALAKIVGADGVTRIEVGHRVLKYIEDNQLQDKKTPTQIICDPVLFEITGEARFSMFRLTKLLAGHLR